MPAPVLLPPLREGDRLTRDEFMRRWDGMPDLGRAELIDGVVYMASPVSRPHRTFQYRLNGWLILYSLSTPGLDGGAGGTWLMREDGVPQPDLDLLLRMENGYSVGARELAIEVSQTNSVKDAGVKLRLYERSGVRDYIIVRPEKKAIVWRELAGGKYREIPPDADGIYRSRVFPGLWLDPEARRTAAPRMHEGSSAPP